MKRAFLKLILFISPFIIISLLIFLADPYNLFNCSHLFSDEAKLKCLNRSDAISPRGNTLWNIIEFERSPTSNVILGDSRIYDISRPLLEKRVGGKITNLSIKGSNYRTLIDMFWMAAKRTKLDNVIIQVNFFEYNATYNFDLFNPAMALVENPVKYFLSSNYVKDSFSLAYYALSGNENFVNREFKLKGDPWDRAEAFLILLMASKEFAYPDNYYKGLKKIAEYCRDEKINLLFVIAPDYYEVHNLISKYNLEESYRRFKSDITSLSTTIDLNEGHPFSFSKDNYYDYVHIKFAIQDTLVSMIFNSDEAKRYFSRN